MSITRISLASKFVAGISNNFARPRHSLEPKFAVQISPKERTVQSSNAAPAYASSRASSSRG